ncbi:class I SAM-dependent DNA methyltransferase [Methylobacterium sp. sgz302541]|uniref:class I SAM-dependent DNA methyltransferase n=1 Tax=unclassified Methylobacterium TaxID=2615210 RepID=UPI003D337F15
MSRQRSSGDLLADRRYAYAESCLAEGDAAGAAEMAEQALELAPRFAPAWALLGRAREALFSAGAGEAAFHAALRAYAAALDIDPEDALGARMRLAVLGLGDGTRAMSAAYVRALFDGYAERFDRHLVDGLGYRGPQLLREALDAVAGAGARFGTALDLGCGTGLVGEVLAGRADRLVGIDLSPAMLAKARAKGLYQRLVAGDLLRALAQEPEGGADLVLAADVFIYVGDLGAPLAAIARALAGGGLAAFTLQTHDGEEPVRLGADARFSQSEAHLREAAGEAGLGVVSLSEAAIRRDRDRDVPGLVAVLAKGSP